METKKELSWKEFADNGKSYYKTSIGMAKKPEKFKTDVVFNIISMAIENMLMALLLKNRYMAKGHTLVQLIDDLGQFYKIDNKLKSDLIYMDNFQQICHLDTYTRSAPSESEIARLLEIMEDVNAIFKHEIE